MQQHSTHSYSVRFRRFLRKNYAVFCSLHKEISIGRLSVDTNNSSLKTLKKKIVEIFFEDNISNDENQEFYELKKSENSIFAPALQAVFVVSKEVYSQIFSRRERRVFAKSAEFFYFALFAFFSLRPLRES